MKLFRMFGRGKDDEDVEDQLEALGDIEDEDYLDDFEEESEDKAEEQPSGEKEEKGVVGLEEKKGEAEAELAGAGAAPAESGAAVQTVAAGPAEKGDDVMDLFEEEQVEELLPKSLLSQLNDIKGSQLLQECMDIKRQLVRR